MAQRWLGGGAVRSSPQSDRSTSLAGRWALNFRVDRSLCETVKVRLADQFRSHFGHREHLCGVLLELLADDLDADGPTAEICAHRMDAARGDAIQLRLLAGLFRVVLRGEAPGLARYYPAVGGSADPADLADHAALWRALTPVLTGHIAELRTALDLAPQTNEVGRSACLAVGLFAALRQHGLRRIRLLEPGASAGLNLNLDRYRLVGAGWSWGPVDSPLTLTGIATSGPPEEFTVVEGRGCDLSPVDLRTAEGATHLRSFVWPFDLTRHERLTAAIEIARRHPVAVDAAPASRWIVEQLADPPAADDVLTVVWQSITQQYWPAAETAAVIEAVAEARTRMPLAHIVMEGLPPMQGTDGYAIGTHGPTTTVDGAVVARSHHHGPPVEDPATPRTGHVPASH